MINYDDFDILISPDGENYQATVIKSSAGTGGSVSFSKDLLQVARVATLGTAAGDDAERGRLRETTGSADDRPLSAEEKGQQLFKALFSGDTLSFFRQSTGTAGGARRRLRVRLQFDLDAKAVARVAMLPWELLYDESQRSFLVRSTDITVVRRLSTRNSGSVIEMKPINGPIRVLLVMADPTGKLNLKAEHDAIDGALKALMAQPSADGAPRRQIQTEFLEGSTFAQLTEKLRNEDFHIIHFMGHGDFSAEHQGKLCFKAEAASDGSSSGTGADWRPAQDLADILRKEKDTRLVTLNACRTAESSGDTGVDPFAGVAQSLVMAGIPAVIAMQFPVSDIAAITFARVLYSELGDGKTIEDAVCAGRLAILSESKGIEWATPVLFLRETVSFEQAATGPWGPPDDNAFRVFLATTIRKMRQFCTPTEVQLRKSGTVRVAIPGQVPDDADGAAAYRNAIAALAATADLSVHILGDDPGESDDDDPLHTQPVEQLRIALESNRPVMVIAPREYRAKIEAHPAYGPFVESLKGRYLGPDGKPHADPEQFEIVFIEDKGAIAAVVADKVERMQRAKAAAAADGGPLSAHVDAFAKDLKFATQLEEFLSGQEIEVNRKTLITPRAFDLDMKDPVYIVVQGDVEKEWVNMRVEAARKSVSTKGANTLVGVYYSVPGSDGKRFESFSVNRLSAKAQELVKKLEAGV